MKLSTRSRTKFKIGVVVLIEGSLLLAPFFSFSQPTFFGVSTNPVDNGSVPGPTVAVSPPAAMAAGDLVVLYGLYGGTGVAMSISSTAGQSWTTATAPAGASNMTYAVFWCRFNGTWAGNPAITVGAGNTNALSVMMYVYRPTVATNSWALHLAATNGTNTNTVIPIGGVTTTVANTVTMGFWSSASSTGTYMGNIDRCWMA
jgi:hypothetical protein